MTFKELGAQEGRSVQCFGGFGSQFESSSYACGVLGIPGTAEGRAATLRGIEAGEKSGLG